MPLRKAFIFILTAFIPFLAAAEQKNIWSYLNPLSDLVLDEKEGRSLPQPTPTISRAKSDTLAMQDLMGERLFFTAGLNNLNEDQMSVLYLWLQEYTQRFQTDKFLLGKEAQKRAEEAQSTELLKPYPIKTKMVSPTLFSGWHGHEVFYMENGQVWRQVGSDWYTPEVPVDPQPEVSIYQEGNVFYMEVQGVSPTVEVKLEAS